MQAAPIHIKKANAFIAKHHRHSLPTVGGKFAVAAIYRGKRAGVTVAGRPVGRRLDDGKIIEVLRVCTDGTPNCCSFLYARSPKSPGCWGTRRSSPIRSKKRAGPACGRWEGGSRVG